MVQQQIGENKRIAKNSVFMYARMFITMLIGLYTSRVILASLGFDDYGLYNVVGGIIAMFGFINGALSNTTSRYITYYLGKKNVGRLQVVFSTTFYVHVILALFIVLVAETIGLWYVCNKLVIPEGRFVAAMWLYQFTVITTVANIISVPFNASVIAHERISFFALIAIIDSVLKLLIALSLTRAPFDILVYYGMLILFVQLMNNIIYWIYSSRKFEGVKIRKVFDKTLFKEIFGFTGWNLFGNFSYVFFTQGINLILNYFCGTVVNAARGITVQVDGIVRQFATNVQTAINPQIIKSYAQGETRRFFSLIFASSRYCYYLLFLLALPISLEAEYLLTIWLGNYPNHTINFLRITLATVSLEALVTPMFMANLASGKVKIYQITMSVIAVIFIPISFFAIKLTGIPEILFVTSLLMTIIEIIARVFIVHNQVALPRKKYIREVMLNIIVVTGLSSIVPIFVHCRLESSLLRFLIVCCVCFLSVGSVVYLVGMKKNERLLLHTFLLSKIKKRV